MLEVGFIRNPPIHWVQTNQLVKLVRMKPTSSTNSERSAFPVRILISELLLGPTIIHTVIKSKTYVHQPDRKSLRIIVLFYYQNLFESFFQSS